MTTPKVEIDGEDLLVRNVRCTCFGGADDPQDNGETASGVSTKNPKTLGVALPRRYTGSDHALLKALGDGIIPHDLPFQTVVEIEELLTGHKVRAPFIDIGPATYTHNYIDATVAVAKLFNEHATARSFEMMCNYRILGAAKHLTGSKASEN